MTTPESFICPITSEIMADPVSTADGFSYEREAITEWFAGGNKTSPITGAPLEHQHMVPNHALRSAIQEFVNANPAVAKDLYQPRTPDSNKATSTSAVNTFPLAPDDAGGSSTPPGIADVSDSPVPVGLPVQQHMPARVGSGRVVPVQAPPAPPLAGLSEADLAACATYQIIDWKRYSQPPKVASSGWFGAFSKPKPKGAATGGAFAQGAPPVARSGSYSADMSAGEPLVRVSTADGGGVALNAEVDSPAQLHRLARLLAAAGSAPVGALRISAKDGYGPGTPAPVEAVGDGFMLLCRALLTASQASNLGNPNLGGVEPRLGASSLGALRELSISKILVSDTAADTLSQALAGHATLATLELYNVNLDDAGGHSVARLATPGGNGALTKLSLGKHCMLGETVIELEERIIDKERVRAQLY